MARKASNRILHQAKASRSDEFYTLYEDIEKELRYYAHHFEGKTIYCNCDNPSTSNFFKYFYDNFLELGLSRLIASFYIPQNNDIFNFEGNNPGGYCIIERKDFENLDRKSPAIIPFKGDGDFRSQECINLLKQADIVVTNPPFSLFRDFVAQMVRYDKKFLIIGNINAITYKEIFTLIQSDSVWLGVHMGRGISGFIVPERYPLYGTEARIDEKGQRIISPNNCLWLTNLDIEHRHSFIELTKTYSGNEAIYPKYDNYDGINVNKTQDIPYDYSGIIGVPITFLHKYNPNQFEIVRFRKGSDEKDLSVNGKCPFFRILIRNRHPRKPAVVSQSLFE